MRKKYFLISLLEIIILIFTIFYMYNKIMYISNESKMKTIEITQKFNIREKNFYEK